MKLTLVMTAAATALFAASAQADLVITEAYGGMSGEDGTADWIEITNLGDSAVSGSGLFYEDESADEDDLTAINGLGDIGVGESVVVMIGTESDTDGFLEFWGILGVQVGWSDGSGLKEGDTAWIYSTADGFFNSLTVSELEDPATTQFGGGISTAANGVSVGLTEQGVMYGDPGSFTVPAPGALALLGLAGISARRRRRA